MAGRALRRLKNGAGNEKSCHIFDFGGDLAALVRRRLWPFRGYNAGFKIRRSFCVGFLGLREFENIKLERLATVCSSGRLCVPLGAFTRGLFLCIRYRKGRGAHKMD